MKHRSHKKASLKHKLIMWTVVLGMGLGMSAMKQPSDH